MIGFTAFKTRKPRQYDYRPRYFDPEKEAREARRNELLGERAETPGAEKDGDDKEYKPGQYIGELRIRRGIVSNRKTGRSKVNGLRMVLLAVMIVLILWYIFS